MLQQGLAVYKRPASMMEGLDSYDRYAPIKRLALIQVQRNPNKPLTPFSISDILSEASRPVSQHRPLLHHHHQHHQLHHPVDSQSFMRPWDDSPSPGSSRTADDEDEDEEINVDDDDIPLPTHTKATGQSPLDALFKMTNKTFDGNDSAAQNDGRSRDSLSLFAKSQPSKKRRKSRTAFTNQQIYELEKRFLYQKYLTPADRDEIASSLGLTNAQVITWFQNRRAKLKRDLEELKSDIKAAKSTLSQEVMSMFNSVEEMQLFQRNYMTKKNGEKASALITKALDVYPSNIDSQDAEPLSPFSDISDHVSRSPSVRDDSKTDITSPCASPKSPQEKSRRTPPSGDAS